MSDDKTATAAATALSDPEVVAATKRFVGVGVEWPRRVVLRAPVAFGKDETLDELVFQKGNFGILKGLGLAPDAQPNLDALMVIASRLCGKPIGIIERLDPDDVEEVVDIARGFFLRCQGIGNKLSGM